MDRPYLSKDLRTFVANRSERLCEYCLIHEDNMILGCSVDHIISLKHGGSNDQNNLANACMFCNRYKGSDIGSIVWETQEFVRFYNPRIDYWADNFRLNEATIVPISSIGEVTVRILGLNDRDRLLERKLLTDRGLYPHPSAVRLINQRT
jgi:hypothetical protein